ncbi:hypothetical protein PRIPAC_78914 [Pristionchus pacificus]|uniref:Uncharacterized protein n=1 Tax=Pristionchus pacificus TaxID=54126 RepID=A0A2A6C3I8_PRIPA|nr:hypothetical protein PRIPAC_78914 [Pristionchus pacificus]|eukprot:PDM72667.1 hypothetical protein PRIPAC_39101 [Pristionchus pacificus]
MVVILTTLFIPHIITDGTTEEKIPSTEWYNHFKMHLARYKELRENGTMATVDEIIEINELKENMTESELKKELEILCEMDDTIYANWSTILFLIQFIAFSILLLYLIFSSLFLRLINYIERHFYKMTARQQDAFIKKWYRYLIFKKHLPLVHHRYKEIQFLHRNCLLCGGRRDAFRCRVTTITTDNQFIVKVQGEGENRIIDVTGPINGMERGMIPMAAAKRLGIPHTPPLA